MFKALRDKIFHASESRSGVRYDTPDVYCDYVSQAAPDACESQMS